MSIDSTAQLHRIAQQLKIQGAGAMRLELLRQLKADANEGVSAVKYAARRQLPKSGGLAERVATSPIKVQVRTSAISAGVRIVATEHDTKPTDKGRIRHPVHGHMDRWVAQDIPKAAGWFTGTLRRMGPKITARLIVSMKVIEKKIQLRG